MGSTEEQMQRGCDLLTAFSTRSSRILNLCPGGALRPSRSPYRAVDRVVQTGGDTTRRVIEPFRPAKTSQVNSLGNSRQEIRRAIYEGQQTSPLFARGSAPNASDPPPRHPWRDCFACGATRARPALPRGCDAARNTSPGRHRLFASEDCRVCGWLFLAWVS